MVGIVTSRRVQYDDVKVLSRRGPQESRRISDNNNVVAYAKLLDVVFENS
jgi:hypothetical protein